MENSLHFLLAFLVKEKSRLTKMIPKSDLLFNIIISIQLDIHFCICFLFVFVFPCVCLPLHRSGTEATPGFNRRAAAAAGLYGGAAMVTGHSSRQPCKASGDGGLYSLRSDAEVLCDWINVFLPVIVYTLILNFFHLLFHTLQV